MLPHWVPTDMCVIWLRAFLIRPLFEGQPGGTSLRFFTSKVEVKTPKKRRPTRRHTQPFLLLAFTPFPIFWGKKPAKNPECFSENNFLSFSSFFVFCSPRDVFSTPLVKYIVQDRKIVLRGKWFPEDFAEKCQNIFRVDVARHSSRP